MDFLRGLFRSQPVIALISCKTSSAMARNSGLFFAGAAGDGAVAACCARAGWRLNRKSAARSRASAVRLRKCLNEAIFLQDSRFSGTPEFDCGRVFNQEGSTWRQALFPEQALRGVDQIAEERGRIHSDG